MERIGRKKRSYIISLGQSSVLNNYREINSGGTMTLS